MDMFFLNNNSYVSSWIIWLNGVFRSYINVYESSRTIWLIERV